MDYGSHCPADHDDGASTSKLQQWSQGPAANAKLSSGGKRRPSLVFVPSAQSDLYAQEAPLDHCLWQVQYYSETLEPSSNVSLLAQTEQEQDDIFYATFPQARGLHWSPQVLPANEYSGYFGGTAFSLSRNGPGHDYRSSGLPEHDPPCTPSVRYSPGSLHIEAGCTSSCIVSSGSMSTIDSCGNDESVARLECDSSQLISLSPERDDLGDVPSSPKIEPFDVPLPKSPLQLDIEDVNTATFSCTHEPLMNFLTPPFTEPEASSPEKSPSHIEDILKMNTTSSPTGTWPSVRVRSIQNTPESDSPTSSNIDRRDTPEPFTSTTTPPLATSSPRAPKPQLDTHFPPESSGLMRLSPLPMNRRPIEKKKAQTLACNFCRIRKVRELATIWVLVVETVIQIACGPPLAGTVEKTCKSAGEYSVYRWSSCDIADVLFSVSAVL
ncbi:hypothetical protein C8R41DRAFT_919120 [Lentinula lateritia]|uniref:Uncharacterized protein n=1 Tax=Lentinula lateritia TaxID=40482 RepID=A0ABQ8VHM4_9AGAR|nr:hypothetical protein C8R41DRAFT_919120 [Lentinula lateritia]